ncbi:hypothetical protein [Croceicoccus marinus]|nr:hypothetical protein [Croceicoccus marinus]
MWIALQALLNLQGQPLHALAHLWTPLAVQGFSDHVQIGLAAAIYPA